MGILGGGATVQNAPNLVASQRNEETGSVLWSYRPLHELHQIPLGRPFFDHAGAVLLGNLLGLFFPRLFFFPSQSLVTFHHVPFLLDRERRQICQVARSYNILKHDLNLVIVRSGEVEIIHGPMSVEMWKMVVVAVMGFSWECVPRRAVV
jgi:hypothetical protein